MTGKIKSKDLSYSSDLPPFLQRLHAQNAGHGDRHERPIARPKKEKNPDDDDGPTIIDESGDTVTKEEMERLASKDSEGKEFDVTEPSVASDLSDGKRVKQQETDAGKASKKRKAAKIVGEDEADPEVLKGFGEKTVAAKKPKKKAKPIKLAFEDDEG